MELTLTDIHGRLATTAVIFSLICAAWGFLSYFRRQGITSSYWGTLAICEFLMVAQGVIGLILMLDGKVPYRGNLVHLLYGSTSIISLPAAYIYTKGRDDRQHALLYGVVCLWLFGISLRGITTGGG